MCGRIAAKWCGAVAIAALCGCSLFHRETPQQKFLDAMSRGNSAQASQIWLGMSAEDRVKFSRGEGVPPSVPPDKVNAMLSQMQTDEDKPVTLQSATGKALTDLEKYGSQAPPAPPPTQEQR